MKYLDSAGLSYLWGKLKAKFVPQTRKINGKSLSADITLLPSDIGAVSTADLEAAVQQLTELINASKGFVSTEDDM